MEPGGHISPCLHPARRMTVIMMDLRWEGEKINKITPTKAQYTRPYDKLAMESVTVIYVSNKRGEHGEVKGTRLARLDRARFPVRRLPLSALFVL